MSANAKRTGFSVSRSIHIEYNPGGDEDVPQAIAEPVEKLLVKAKRAGFIDQYDVDQIIWFNGNPGKAMRALRKQIEHVIVANGCAATRKSLATRRKEAR